METTIVYWGYIGKMEKKMEATLNPKPSICSAELSPQKPELAKKRTPSMSIPRLKPLEFRVLGFRV